DRCPMLPANGRVRSLYLRAHAAQCLPAATDQLVKGEELEQPPLAAGLAALTQARSLWKWQLPLGGPELPQLPAPMLGQRELGQYSRTLRRKSPPRGELRSSRAQC